MIENNMLW